MVFAILGVLGTLPLACAIALWVAQPFELATFVQQAIATPAALVAWLDVVLTAVVLLIWLTQEGLRLQMPRLWLYVLATLLVGPSLGLPLFLWQRSRYRSAAPTTSQDRFVAS